MKSALSFGAFAVTASAAAVDVCKNLPAVNSKELQAAVKTDKLLQGCEKLIEFAESTPARNRQVGTKGHNLTTDRLVEELEKLNGYYKIETQTFWYNTMITGTLSLEIDGEPADGGLIDYSPTGDVSALIVVVSNLGCNSADYTEEISGNIALVVRGTCPFVQKSALAGAAGAVGALVYNNIPDRLEATLDPDARPEGNFVPTIGLSDVQGQNLATAITGGATIMASLHVETEIKNLSTVNVIATSNCGSSDSVLVLGAHTDSVFRGPGINDNGLSAEDKANIGAYLNFDTIASPNYMNGIYDDDGPTGSVDIFHFYQVPFLDAGIPSGGLFTGADGIKTEEEEALFGGTASQPYDSNFHTVKEDAKQFEVGHLHATRQGHCCGGGRVCD
ncbi:transferrin receptor ectodomain, apical domain-containing protein [Bimuria novae-zelandiae CBS 107.79]|uniref:Peptide hydrolase n=1 Tax=Bimuria novae-zelandiae CBS 107.79 TaxID=1447943 RepID=A0A6A5VEM5_9PLEO|nr:transferrin receptor ectodomain, apical domain-containing protein [Bimuria novae-zelandiae CBS 107.79]